MRTSILTVCAVLALLAPAAADAQPTGAWQRDTLRSDSPNEAIRQALAAANAGQRDRVPFTVVRNPDGTTSGGPPVAPPRRAAGTTASPAQDMQNPVVRAAFLGLQGGRLLHIAVDDDAIVIGYDGGEPLRLVEGRQRVARWGLDDLEVTVKLGARRVEIETRGPERLRVQERYELKPNGELEARMRAEKSGLPKVAQARYIYTAMDP
jgi:hypothetical protein